MGGFSLLGQLAGGYAQAAERQRRLDFEQQAQQRQNALWLTKTLLDNPNTPAEYKTLLAQYGMNVINSKGKLPDFNKEVVMQTPQINTPARTQNAPIPQLNLGMPAVPPAPQGIGTGQQQGAPSLTQSATAANGGTPSYQQPIPLPAAPPAIGNRATAAPQAIPQAAGQSLPPVAPPPIPMQTATGPNGQPIPVMTQQGGPTLPGGQAPVTLAPQQIAPAGQFHMLSPEELAQQQQTIKMNQVMQIARDTGKSPAEVMGLAQPFTLGPGQTRYDAEGNPVAQSTAPRAGQVGMEPVFAPGGEFVGVKDHLTGQLLTGQDLLANPEAAKVAQASLNAVAEKEKKGEAKENRQATRQAQQQARAFAQQYAMFNKREESATYKGLSTQLDKVAQPVEQLASRFGRLEDTLAQGTPQADALVAPELLTVMAGGQGSGLRMNEAEIARLVGGRSKWESLKASVNKWRLDPAAARSITPEQSREIHLLMDAVKKRLDAKRQIIDDARDDLLSSQSPTEQRKIFADARSKILKVDTGSETPSGGSGSGSGGGGPKVGTVEDGYRFKGGDPANPSSWEKVQ